MIKSSKNLTQGVAPSPNVFQIHLKIKNKFHIHKKKSPEKDAFC